MIRRPPRSTLFPSRRSSDLSALPLDAIAPQIRAAVRGLDASLPIVRLQTMDEAFGRSVRSEEHTSELQSQSNLVCRLLLEKKKKKKSHIKAIKSLKN